MKTKITLSVTFLFIALSFYTNAQTQKYSKAIEAVEKYATKKIKQNKVTGLSVAIVDGDSIVWAKGYGYSDKKNNIPATPKTLYPMGCVQKIFTTAAVLKLYQEGKIDLDDPFVKHVPEFSMKKHFKEDNPFTIRQLLTHTSGIPRVRGKNHHSEEPRPFREIIEEEKDDYLLAPPNTFIYYSDWSFLLLGVLIENVSGMSYEKYMQENIYDPLDMETAGIKDFKYVDNLTKGYNPQGEELEVYNSRAKSAEAGYASALDMAKFAKLFLNNGKVGGKQLLQKSVIEKSYQKQNNNLKFQYGPDYGLCWSTEKFMGIKHVAKWGGHPMGINAVIRLLPEHNLAVVACENTTDFEVGGISHIALKELLASKGIEGEKWQKPKLSKSKFTKDRIDFITGTYMTEIGLLELRSKNNKVYTTLEGHKLEIKPCENNTYKATAKLLGIIPITVKNIFIEENHGRVLMGAYDSPTRKFIMGEKVKPVEIPDTWKQMLGNFEVSYENEARTLDYVKVYVKNNLLVLEAKSKFVDENSFRLVLKPISDDLAIVQGLTAGEFFSSETIRIIEKNGEKMLVFSGYELKKKHN